MMCYFLMQDMRRAQAQKQGSSVNVEVDAPQGVDLAKIIADMRKEYEAIIEKNRREVEEWYKHQVQKRLCIRCIQNTSNGCQKASHFVHSTLSVAHIESKMSVLCRAVTYFPLHKMLLTHDVIYRVVCPLGAFH